MHDGWCLYWELPSVMRRLNPAVQLRWGCQSCMSLGPSRARLYSYRSVLVGRHTHNVHYIHGQLHRSTLCIWTAAMPHPVPLSGCPGLPPLNREYIMCLCVQHGQSLFPKYPVSAGASTWTYELPKPLLRSGFQNKLPDTQTWTQMHNTDALAAGLPCANYPVAGSGVSFSTQVSQSTPRPSSLSSG